MPLPRCRIPILTVAGLIQIAARHGFPRTWSAGISKSRLARA